ncbi:MAG TPA: TIM barrel protein, partial [Clostridia bacterium]|nr:TIM barrel protein [Clostridia bacterium]
MRIGIATTDFTALPGAELLDRIEGYGFEAVQLSLADVAELNFVPNGEIEIPEHLDPAIVAQVGRQARTRRLPLVALNGTFNMAHPDPAVRAEGLRRLEGLSKAANALEVPLITLCSGTRNRAHLWRPHPDNGTPEAW